MGKLYEMMHVANAYYHFNFTMCLASETPSGIAVESIPTIGTQSLIHTNTAKEFNEDKFTDMKKFVESYADSLYFPSPSTLLNGEKLCELYSGVKGSAGSAKLAFIKGLEKFKKEEINQTQFDGFIYDYSNALKDLFEPKKMDQKSGFNLFVDEAKDKALPAVLAGEKGIIESIRYFGIKYGYKCIVSCLNTQISEHNMIQLRVKITSM